MRTYVLWRGPVGIHKNILTGHCQELFQPKKCLLANIHHKHHIGSNFPAVACAPSKTLKNKQKTTLNVQ